MLFTQIIPEVVSSAFAAIGSYLPRFFGGLFILFVGLIIASILKHALETLFKVIKLDKVAEDAKIAKSKDIRVWSDFLGELVRWTIIIVFLVPAVELWGVAQITDILNQLLLYLPNVFIAVVVGFVGVVIANLVSDAVSHSVKGLGSKSAGALAAVAKYAILFFTTLIVLNQLNVAADLIRILFTGIVAMLALAGGLAFGLGGKEVAQDILRSLQKKIEGK